MQVVTFGRDRSARFVRESLLGRPFSNCIFQVFKLGVLLRSGGSLDCWVVLVNPIQGGMHFSQCAFFAEFDRRIFRREFCREFVHEIRFSALPNAAYNGWKRGNLFLERFFERHRFSTFQSLAHKRIPEWRDNVRRYFVHWAVVVVPRPGSHNKVGSVADDPRIAKIVGCAGFYRDVPTGEVQWRALSERRRSGFVIREHIGDGEGGFLFEYALIGITPFFNDRAVFVLKAKDTAYLSTKASRGECSICAG